MFTTTLAAVKAELNFDKLTVTRNPNSGKWFAVGQRGQEVIMNPIFVKNTRVKEDGSTTPEWDPKKPSAVLVNDEGQMTLINKEEFVF